MNLEQTINYIKNAGERDLFILWTNADVITAKLMVFMYAENACKQKLWDNIMIIIWGSTAKLAAENKAVQEKINELQEMGISFSACVTCAKELDVEDDLKELGIDLVKWLHPMTEIVKGHKNMITV